MSLHNLKMVDLKGQYERIRVRIDEAIQSVLSSTVYVNGNIVWEFANNLAKYLNVNHVIPCANGTDALQIALMSLGLKPGDEVIIPSFTYIATAEVVLLLGLKPVFVDVCHDDFCIDVESIKSKLTEHTRAIIPVHLFGQSVDMQPLLSLAKEKNIYVIEDNAQAIGCRYRGLYTGSMGTFGTTSFFPSKNLGACGDGGALMTNDKHLADIARQVANHGQSCRYYHDILGCNSRLDSIQAAILNVKLEELDTYIALRQRAAQSYDYHFKDNAHITIPINKPYSTHVYHQYTLKLRGVNRDEVVRKLHQQGIPCTIYYPLPCHKQKMLGHTQDIKASNLPITAQLCASVLSLPMHTEMNEQQISYIANKLMDVVNQTIDKIN